MNFRSAFTVLALSAIAASIASAQQGDKKAPAGPVQQAGVTVAKADSGAKTAKKKGGKKKKAQAKKDSTSAEIKKSS